MRALPMALVLTAAFVLACSRSDEDAPSTAEAQVDDGSHPDDPPHGQRFRVESLRAARDAPLSAADGGGRAWIDGDTRITAGALGRWEIHYEAGELGVAADAVLSGDAMCHDVVPSTLAGVDEELVAAPRLDNLCSSFNALEALLATDGAGKDERIAVITLFDHEEVGSTSHRGAGSQLLRDVLERTVLARGGSREDYHRAIADSACVSADMAHATHPNYPEKHEPDHSLFLNQGPVIKINSNLRYASDGETEALFQTACDAAGVPYQKWVNRTDLACGSTIGPITAANLGMRTVDVGCPQLAMHSIREMCGALDPGYMSRAMAAFLRLP